MCKDRPKYRSRGAPNPTLQDSPLLGAKTRSLSFRKSAQDSCLGKAPSPFLDLGRGEAALGRRTSLRDFQRQEILEINLWVLHMFFSVLTIEDH